MAKKKATAPAQDWRNRIIDHGVKPADQFTPHPLNARLHPDFQREAVKVSLDTLGWIAPVIESKTSGYVVDGHERVWQALETNAEVPYIVVDLTEREEAQALLIFDPITGLAQTAFDKLDALRAAAQVEHPALVALSDKIKSQSALADQIVRETRSPNFDATLLPDSATGGTLKVTYIMYITFRTAEARNEALELISLGGRGGIEAVAAVIDGEEYLETWREHFGT